MFYESSFPLLLFRLKSTFVHFVNKNFTAKDLLEGIRAWKPGQVVKMLIFIFNVLFHSLIFQILH